MKKLCASLLGLALAGAGAFPASAADWYRGSQAPGGYAAVPPPVPVWAGFYAGVNLGYGWSAASDQLACTSDTCAAITGAPLGGLAASGWLGSIQLGYNWQGFGFPPLVLGFETDIQPSSVYGQRPDASGNFFHSRLEALGTARGRFGYAMDCVLLYFTGGLAYGTVLNEAVLANGSHYLANPTVTGYVLGGGVEYKFWRDLAVKIEYQYVNLGKNDPVDAINRTGTYTANGGTIRDDAFNTVRVGLNWWPFAPQEPLK